MVASRQHRPLPPCLRRIGARTIYRSRECQHRYDRLVEDIMSDRERIRSIIASAKKAYEDKLHAEERIASKKAKEWKDSSAEGTPWLREHVIPKLHALLQDLPPPAIPPHTTENPHPHSPH